MAKKPPKKAPKITKITDERFVLRRRGGILNEEVWVDERQNVVGYNLAYINPRISGVDNGRVLGYDNSHGYHHRHFKGCTEPFDYEAYDKLNERFRAEVQELWRKEDEKRT